MDWRRFCSWLTDLLGWVFSSSSVCSFCSNGDALSMCKSQSGGTTRGVMVNVQNIIHYYCILFLISVVVCWLEINNNDYFYARLRNSGQFWRCFERLLTKILKQRLYKTGAVAIETAVHVHVWSVDCGKHKLGVRNRIKVRVWIVVYAKVRRVKITRVWRHAENGQVSSVRINWKSACLNK